MNPTRSLSKSVELQFKPVRNLEENSKKLTLILSNHQIPMRGFELANSIGRMRLHVLSVKRGCTLRKRGCTLEKRFKRFKILCCLLNSEGADFSLCGFFENSKETLTYIGSAFSMLMALRLEIFQDNLIFEEVDWSVVLKILLIQLLIVDGRSHKIHTSIVIITFSFKLMPDHL